MSKAFCILFFLFFTVAQSQTTPVALQGVWTIAAMGKLGDDSAVILNRDSTIARAFPAIYFSHIADKMEAAGTPAEYLGYATLGMFSNMFMQFDSSGHYGEGMMPKAKEDNPVVKRGTYLINGHTLITTTKQAEKSEFVIQGGFLRIITSTGSMMYLSRVGNKLF